MGSPYSQDRARIRMEWGPVGAAHTAPSAEFAVVVDVLSFTTTLSVALDRRVEVFPYRWRDESAAVYAASQDATLAVGRLEARRSDHQHGRRSVSLSPDSIRQAGELTRLVLPSPNGSTISFGLADAGVRVLGASLRNRTAVAEWLAAQLGTRHDAAVTVIAAGERWPDGSLRPAVEDLWGAGAVIDALHGRGLDDLSPEAQTAAASFRSVQSVLAEKLMRCSSGRELDEATFGAEIAVAAELDQSDCVPMLVDGRFIDATKP
ncbi:2-phosphosulfolactate phosphatase [Phytoactinopolyspora mesophila]|uniref:Probable 2-phosphosulfolactate phosphatase n=1 Tax=Phytoactinopolyspora mesophila TaxID=2650750 RepID=A0A7K3M2D2_9ACTN|nr:2-phosphosulfolactate phosphatase [Phytoactinopolyspora mesophila]NDL57082.1 2-phosphosulfolactate phosphatase [Phytoactinopolyspora mesophila]